MPSRVREQAGHVPASYFKVLPNRFNLEAVTTNTQTEGDAPENSPVFKLCFFHILSKGIRYIYIYIRSTLFNISIFSPVLFLA